MSLINEALKKAQERQKNTGLPAAGDSHAASSQLTPPNKSPQWILIGIFAVVLILIVSGATAMIVYGLLQSKDPAPSPVAQSASTNLPETAPTPLPSQSIADPELERIAFNTPELDTKVTPESPAPQEPTELTQTEATPKIPQQPTSEPKITSSESNPIKESPSIASTPEISNTPPTPPTPPTPTPNPEIQAYIQNLSVRGVMSGGGKVLIFDPELSSSTAYELNAPLRSRFNLRITEIANRQLKFTDNDGIIYTKPF